MFTLYIYIYIYIYIYKFIKKVISRNNSRQKMNLALTDISRHFKYVKYKGKLYQLNRILLLSL